MEITPQRFEAWLSGTAKRFAQAQGKARRRAAVRSVGVLPPDVRQALAREGISVSSGRVVITAEEVASLVRTAKGGKNVPVATLSKIGSALSAAPAYLDLRSHMIAFVVPVEGSDKVARIMVAPGKSIRIPPAGGRRRADAKMNAVWSASLVESRVMADRNAYKPLVR